MPSSDHEMWEAVTKAGQAFSVFREDLLIAAAGIIPQWYGRATAWALFRGTKVDRYDMIWVHRETVKFLDHVQTTNRFRRIETTVDDEFEAGHRWALMLGFEFEGVMDCYDMDGRAHSLYSRIAPCQYPSS